MDISETDFETVLSKLFDDEKNPNKVSARRLMKKIAPYVGRNSLELEELYNLLDPSDVNPNVSRDRFKKALLQWSESMKTTKDSCFVEEVLLVTKSSASDQYTNTSSMSNNSFKERIVELQNELAEKEHIIKSMRKQLEYSSQLTLQHEDTLTQVTTEKDNLYKKLVIAQNNSNMCDLLKSDYDEQMECLNMYKEKCTSLEHVLDGIKKENVCLNAKIIQIENEKLNLIQLISSVREERDRMQNQLSTSYGDKETLMSENVHYKEKISEQESVIKDLHLIKHSLEVDLQNSINKSVHYLTQYMDRMDESFHGPLDEDLKSQLRGKMAFTPVKRVRSHSEGSIGRECITNNSPLRETCTAQHPLHHQASLLEELEQVKASTVTSDAGQQTDLMFPTVISCEAESTSDSTRNIDGVDVGNCSGRESILVLEHAVVVSHQETQTDDEFGIVALKNGDNALAVRSAEAGGVCYMRKLRRFFCGVFGIIPIIGTCICVAYAALHMYNTLRYCYNVRRGTNVHIYPSEWFTLKEVIDSLFEVRHTGPAPI